MKLWYWLTGGRPMIYDGFAFTDKVDGSRVCYWRDPRDDGRRWLAETRWARFRVEANEG